MNSMLYNKRNIFEHMNFFTVEITYFTYCYNCLRRNFLKKTSFENIKQKFITFLKKLQNVVFSSVAVNKPRYEKLVHQNI